MPHRTIREIFIRREAPRLRPDTSVREAAKAMAEQRIGAVLVMEDDQLKGIFTERDALYRIIAEGRDPERTTLGEVMTTSVVRMTPDDTVTDALRIMRDVGFRHLPLVEDERVAGLLSLRDFIGAAEFATVRDRKEASTAAGT